MNQPIDIARAWLASNDPTDGHLAADILAAEVIRQDEAIVRVQAEVRELKAFALRLYEEYKASCTVSPPESEIITRGQRLGVIGADE
jgi:hypothetical protein